ncbi:MAG: DUF2992 family protein [Spirochaetales bacterium]|nr:DUF2992 family protein [Spirochaetales bacterium]
MDTVITTIYYDGQFWKALVEKESSDGGIFMAEYIFGQEPSNPEVLDFYLNKYEDLLFLQVEEHKKIKPEKILKRSPDRISKSYNEYKDSLRTYLEDKKTEKRILKKVSEQDRYEEKRKKKKLKKRGR